MFSIRNLRICDGMKLAECLGKQLLWGLTGAGRPFAKQPKLLCGQSNGLVIGGHLNSIPRANRWREAATFDVLALADHTGAMHQRSRILRWINPGDGRALSASAVVQGAAVGAGGALVMTTLVGVAAVVGMNLQGLSPDAILQEFRQGIAIRGFIVAAELLTAIAAGYVAARIAARRPTAHALWAAAGTIVLKCVTWLLLGNPWPIGLAAVDLILVLPCALLGGYLASPSCPQTAKATAPPV